MDEQLKKHYPELKTPYSKDMYENWVSIEMAMRKFDRWFNRVEKFESRFYLDPDNHDRREKRMVERKKDRWLDNYAYFFGGLNEEEQMYRDYFETDIEMYPEDEAELERIDKQIIQQHQDFRLDNFDFQETQNDYEISENVEDIIDKKIFQYKYRMAGDDPETYFRRQERVQQRFFQRAQHRDPQVETNLAELLERDSRESHFGQQIL